jgi:hypothetical protein
VFALLTQFSVHSRSDLEEPQRDSVPREQGYGGEVSVCSHSEDLGRMLRTLAYTVCRCESWVVLFPVM